MPNPSLDQALTDFYEATAGSVHLIQVELVKLVLGSTTYYMTSQPRPVIAGGNTYSSVPFGLSWPRVEKNTTAIGAELNIPIASMPDGSVPILLAAAIDFEVEAQLGLLEPHTGTPAAPPTITENLVEPLRYEGDAYEISAKEVRFRLVLNRSLTGAFPRMRYARARFPFLPDHG